MTKNAMAETTDQVVERLGQIEERLNAATDGDWTPVEGHESDDWGVTEAGTHGKSIAQMCWEWDAKFIAHAKDDVAFLLAALREALRIGREQAAQTVELIWKHGNVVFSREARDELQYAIRYPEKSDELAAIRNLSTEE